MIRLTALAFIAAGAGALVWTQASRDPSSTMVPPPNEAPPDLGPVSELVGISAWPNTDGTSFEEVCSDVTVLQFWTFGCPKSSS